jgi:two-component system, chemotaxis family, protein-glutamate methylesterase/glutaminase
MDDPIRVLVVDDALFMRKAISEILQSDHSLSVVGTAKDGLDGLEKIRQLQPDVVTLDIDMPRMDGLAAIRHIMIESPVPVVVLSSLFSDGAVTFEALRLGVLDFVPKPSGGISDDMDRSRRRIIDRVKIAGNINFDNIRRVRIQSAAPNENLPNLFGHYPLDYLVTLGTSLSGPNTVIRLLTRLSPALPAAMVVVQEIAPQILNAFAKRFDEHVPWTVKVANDGQILEQGVCYVCSNTQAVRIDRNESDQPCIRLGEAIDDPLNELFVTASEVFRDKTIGVLLTGIGDDGADGFTRICDYGGNTIAQESNCCVYPNLTHNAIEKGTVKTIVDEMHLPGAIADAMS